MGKEGGEGDLRKDVVIRKRALEAMEELSFVVRHERFGLEPIQVNPTGPWSMHRRSSDQYCSNKE